jgi:hypothetical protein
LIEKELRGVPRPNAGDGTYVDAIAVKFVARVQIWRTRSAPVK